MYLADEKFTGSEILAKVGESISNPVEQMAIIRALLPAMAEGELLPVHSIPRGVIAESMALRVETMQVRLVRGVSMEATPTDLPNVYFCEKKFYNGHLLGTVGYFYGPRLLPDK